MQTSQSYFTLVRLDLFNFDDAVTQKPCLKSGPTQRKQPTFIDENQDQGCSVQTSTILRSVEIIGKYKILSVRKSDKVRELYAQLQFSVKGIFIIHSLVVSKKRRSLEVWGFRQGVPSSLHISDRRAACLSQRFHSPALIERSLIIEFHSLLVHE